jgi:OOP family OmpA-OmpF porin
MARRTLPALVVVGALLGAPALPAAQAAAPAATQGRVVEVVREGRVLEIVRRVASISGAVRTVETAETVEVELSSDVLFAFDSADLSPEAADSIADVAARVAQEATGPVGVVGHTDSVGSTSYNQTLSEQRAQAVATALAAITPADYAVSGEGESDPVAPNEIDGADNPAGRQLNRRVTISFSTAG